MRGTTTSGRTATGRRRWTALAAGATAAASAAALVSVAAGALPGAQAATAPGGSPDPTAFWILSRSGTDIASTRSCSGFGSRSDIIEYRDGMGQNRKSLGPLRHPDVTCTFSAGQLAELYAWRSDVVQRGAAAATEVEARLVDNTGTTVLTWRLGRAFPSQLLQTFDRTVLVLTHEGAELLP